MVKDLTESSHDRQNILNNRYALQQAEQHLALGGVLFQGETVFTKTQVAALANSAFRPSSTRKVKVASLMALSSCVTRSVQCSTIP
jgi:hypothetical protein